jgi:hypothetical protein
MTASHGVKCKKRNHNYSFHSAHTFGGHSRSSKFQANGKISVSKKVALHAHSVLTSFCFLQNLEIQSHLHRHTIVGGGGGGHVLVVVVSLLVGRLAERVSLRVKAAGARLGALAVAQHVVLRVVDGGRLGGQHRPPLLGLPRQVAVGDGRRRDVHAQVAALVGDDAERLLGRRRAHLQVAGRRLVCRRLLRQVHVRGAARRVDHLVRRAHYLQVVLHLDRGRPVLQVQVRVVLFSGQGVRLVDWEISQCLF